MSAYPSRPFSSHHRITHINAATKHNSLSSLGAPRIRRGFSASLVQPITDRQVVAWTCFVVAGRCDSDVRACGEVMDRGEEIRELWEGEGT